MHLTPSCRSVTRRVKFHVTSHQGQEDGSVSPKLRFSRFSRQLKRGPPLHFTAMRRSEPEHFPWRWPAESRGISGRRRWIWQPRQPGASLGMHRYMIEVVYELQPPVIKRHRGADSADGVLKIKPCLYWCPAGVGCRVIKCENITSSMHMGSVFNFFSQFI